MKYLTRRGDRHSIALIPKCASRSIKLALGNNDALETPRDIRIGFIRDPIDRLISAWNYSQRRKPWDRMPNTDTYKQLVDHILSGRSNNPHWALQSDADVTKWYWFEDLSVVWADLYKARLPLQQVGRKRKEFTRQNTYRLAELEAHYAPDFAIRRATSRF